MPSFDVAKSAFVSYCPTSIAGDAASNGTDFRADGSNEKTVVGYSGDVNA